MFVWYVVWEWVDYEFVFEMLRCVFVFLVVVVVVVVDDDDVVGAVVVIVIVS